IGVASVKGIYDGTLRLSDLHPPERYHMTVDGKGARGLLHGDGTLSLEARDPNTTVVSYIGQAQLGGPIAGVGMRVAGGAANMLIKAYFSKLADLLAERVPVAASTSATADVLSEEVVDSPLQGPPPSPVAVETAPAAAPSQSFSAASAGPLRAATPVASAAPPPPAAAATLPERGPLMRLVRRAGLSDGSIESERRWARGIVGVLLLVAAVIVLIAVLATRSRRR
ncbi:MAG: SRPBCC domain-containing protein, partial [Ktedonobacterales bacterium]